MIAAVIECPDGYVCNIYPAWEAGQYLVFFGGIALVFGFLIGLVVWFTR